MHNLIEKQHNVNVLIIGSGGAGLRCAIELWDHGIKDILIVGKCELGNAHTKEAEGGINAALGNVDTQDNWLHHTKDTLGESGFLSNGTQAELVCKHIIEDVLELQKMGVHFNLTKDGKINQRQFGGQSFNRTCFVGDYTGKAILDTLVVHVKKRKIENLENVYITKLLLQKTENENYAKKISGTAELNPKTKNENSGKKITGAIGLNTKTGEFQLFQALYVILATGGYTRVYATSSSDQFVNTGDSIWLALNAGLQLMDMEMTQFHPTGMVWPEEARGKLVTEGVRSEGGKLLNSKGERFMEKYDPERMELSTRDRVARANYFEIRAGNTTPHGGMWLDITHRKSEYIQERLPKMIEQFKQYGNIDIRTQKMEVAPTAHYSMGGVIIEPETGASTVQGLYVIGEASAGLHGGNRLGGNSLAEIIVWGKLSAKDIAKKLKEENKMEKIEIKLNRNKMANQKIKTIEEKEIVNEIYRIENLGKGNGENPLTLRAELQKLMWEHAGVARNEKLLKEGLNKLKALKQKMQNMKIKPCLKNNMELIAGLDLIAQVQTVECILLSALERRESRAAHYREDYLDTKEEWLINLVCTRTKDGKIEISKKSVVKPSKEVLAFLEKEKIVYGEWKNK